MDETVRLALHALLVSTFSEMIIYYRPSGNIQLQYPCIVYETRSTDATYANNKSYSIGEDYQLMILSQLPGNIQKRRVYSMPGCIVKSTNSYVSDDVVHDVFNINFKP